MRNISEVMEATATKEKPPDCTPKPDWLTADSVLTGFDTACMNLDTNSSRMVAVAIQMMANSNKICRASPTAPIIEMIGAKMPTVKMMLSVHKSECG